MKFSMPCDEGPVGLAAAAAARSRAPPTMCIRVQQGRGKAGDRGGGEALMAAEGGAYTRLCIAPRALQHIACVLLQVALAAFPQLQLACKAKHRTRMVAAAANALTPSSTCALCLPPRGRGAVLGTAKPELAPPPPSPPALPWVLRLPACHFPPQFRPVPPPHPAPAPTDTHPPTHLHCVGALCRVKLHAGLHQVMQLLGVGQGGVLGPRYGAAACRGGGRWA